MVRLWKEGYDVVYAQRSTRKDKLSKKFSAFLFYRILGAVSTVKIPWDTGDFRLADRRCYRRAAQHAGKIALLARSNPLVGSLPNRYSH